MADVARRFWLFVAPLLVGFSALGLLVLAFFFPGQLYAVGSTGYVATAAVAVAALGVLVWQSVVYDDAAVGGLDGPEDGRR